MKRVALLAALLSAVAHAVPPPTTPPVPVYIIDGGVAVSFPATQAVSAVALPLPSGASTEATLAAIKAKTDNLDVALSTRTKPADTQVVSVGNSPTVLQGTSPWVTSISGTATVTGPLTDAQLRASTVPVSGTVTANAGSGTQAVSLASVPTHAVTLASTTLTGTSAVSAASLPLPTGASTEATLATLLTSGTFTARLGTLGQKAMSGSAPVVISSDQTAIPVSGTFWQATQPISGTVTANAGSGTQAVSLVTLPALAAGSAVIGHTINDTGSTTAVTGTVTVTGPLTDTQLRASAVPVSLTSTTVTGSVAVTGPVTDTQLRASAVPVSLAVAPALVASTAVIGHVIVDTAPTTAITAAALPLPSGAATESTLAGHFTDAQMRADMVGIHPLSPTGWDGGTTTDVSGSSITVAPHLVFIASPPLNPLLPRCNPVRRTGCQP